MALKRLMSEYKQQLADPNSNFSIEEPNSKNFFIWNGLLFGPNDTIFEGAVLRWELKFPINYPIKAPEFKFLTPISHPNVYSDGKMCISILHEGKDEFEYEHISERWNPSHSVNSIMMSILSVLADPNPDSAANIQAKLEFDNMEEYKKKIYKMVAKSH